jgi:hypothetical protein
VPSTEKGPTVGQRLKRKKEKEKEKRCQVGTLN